MRKVLMVLVGVTTATCLAAGEAAPPAAARHVNFTAKPTAARSGEKTTVNFAVDRGTDVEVAVLAADGGVVRHLAAGVLGARNPPPEPLKAGLAQELAWDGKDDFGKPAAGGPFRFRVRAGTGVKLGRMVGEDPYTFGLINSLTTDEDGNLYITACNGEMNQYAITLKVFSPEGRYLRTLIPFPADLKPEAVGSLARWDESRQAYIPKNAKSLNPSIYPFSLIANAITLISASKKGGIVLTAGMQTCRVDSDGGNFQRPTPMWSAKAGLNNREWNVPQLAASPDGRYIYYSNVAGTKYDPKKFSDTDAKWPQGRIYRQDTSKPGSDPEKFHDLELPNWDEKKYWLPNAWNKRTAAYGLATDAKGNLFVCDLVNQAVVEVSPEGRKVSVSKAPWPERVMVNGDTGDLYVICRLEPPKAGHVGRKLVKISGRGEAARIVAEMPLPWGGEACAAGRVGGKAVLWLAGGGAPICVADKGAAFEVIKTEFKPRGGSLDWSRIAVDYNRDEVYINNGTWRMCRYDGKTGQGGLLKKNGKPFAAVDMAVGYDGALYMRTGETFSGPLERYDRELKPLPFATGKHKLWDIYSRLGMGYCDKGVGAGPKGECYTSYMFGWNQYFVAGFSGDGKPMKGRFLGSKVGNAVIGPIPAESGGLAVDLAGNIYVGMRLYPRSFAAPAGFEKDPAYTTWTGSVVKFPPSGGTVLGAVKEHDQANAEGEKTPCNWGMTVVGATGIYPGIAPFSAGGYGTDGSCCVCRVPRFGVDRYGRLALPNCVTCSVLLVDNAGNRILEFGGYGNFDSQHVNPGLEAGQAGRPTVAVPEFPMAWVTGAGFSEDHVYVVDTFNKRVLRADKTFAVETACAIP